MAALIYPTMRSPSVTSILIFFLFGNGLNLGPIPHTQNTFSQPREESLRNKHPPIIYFYNIFTLNALINVTEILKN